MSFFVPKKDQCVVCTKFKRLSGNQSATSTRHQDDTLQYENHIKEKNRAQEEKTNDKLRMENDPQFLCATFDLQSVLQIPSGDISSLYYKRKLVLYNLTIYEMKKPNNAYCFLWLETDGKKGGNEIGSILIQYLKSYLPKGIKHVSFFSDSCIGQNRNQLVTSAIMYACQVLFDDMTIDLKFLIPGHTHMECDSMHASIEFAKKNVEIFSLHEWVNVMKCARRKHPYTVIPLTHSDFYDLKTLSSTLIKNRNKTADGENINWLFIRWIRIQSTTPYQLLVKTSFDEEFKMINQLQSRGRPSLLKIVPAYPTKIAITTAKYHDLLNLCNSGIIPLQYHDFFEMLLHNTGKEYCAGASKDDSEEDD